MFYPLNDDRGASVHYEAWLAQFCASMSLRVALFYRDVEANQLTNAQAVLLDQAVDTWRAFIAGSIPSPGRFEQHLLPLDVLESADDHRLPPNFNRYLARILDIDLVAGPDVAFTFAKPGPFCVLGMIQLPEKRVFHGTRVNLNGGTIMPRAYVVPAPFGEYLADKARRVASASGSMSARQKQKINDEVVANPDRFARSDTARALKADLRMFGSAAFSPRDSDSL